jgi:hypothetical protein
MRKLLLPLLFLGIVGCQPISESYNPYQPRDEYYPSSSRFDPSSRYDSSDQCTFQTNRGSMTGYRPSGKNRCCVDTRDGPSCQGG